MLQYTERDVHMENNERNTTGFTADVELYGADNIIKIYRDYVPQADIEREILCTQTVQSCGILVPEYRGYLNNHKGKRAMLQEYIKGESMMKLLVTGEASPEELAVGFAKVHFDMHSCPVDGLEDSKVRYERLLRLSEYNLGSDLTNRMLRLLEKLPDGNSLCHNDYHPGNLIYNERGIFTIDWSDASAGDPFADVARTIQMFDFGGNVEPGKVDPERAERMQSARGSIKRFVRAYESEYAKLCDMSVDDLRAACGGWMVVVPASRFNIEWDCNKPALLKLFYEYFALNPIKT